MNRYLELPKVREAIEEGARLIQPKWNAGGVELFRGLVRSFGEIPGSDSSTRKEFILWWTNKRDEKLVWWEVTEWEKVPHYVSETLFKVTWNYNGFVYFRGPNGEGVDMLDPDYVESLVTPIDLVHRASGSARAPRTDSGMNPLTHEEVYFHLDSPARLAVRELHLREHCPEFKSLEDYGFPLKRKYPF